MPRVHDRGGWPDAGSINKAEHNYALWEKRTDALLMLLVSPAKKVLRVDELRRAIEALPPEAYEKMSYYERWISAIETLVIEKGLLTREQIEHKMYESWNMPARFMPGDTVRIRVGSPTGHFRTPSYVQGKIGQIEAIHGEFRDPESLAYGKDGLPKKFLYLVSLDQTHLWNTYALHHEIGFLLIFTNIGWN